MNLEDPELHKVPKPWESEQKVLNIKAVGIFGIFLAFGILFYYLTRSGTSEGIYGGLAIAAIFIVMGLGFLIVVIYTNYDQKDHWNIWLPYNKKLYNAINKGIPAMLKENSYKFSEEPNRIEDNKRTFTIKPSLQPEITLYYGLEVVHTKYTTEYHFPIKIKNIRKGNLIYAHQLQKDIHNILTRAEYRSYHDEGKSFPL